jgi:isoaspartyl peptidase/L-asparaginase-like protein (Ntn-hydrolase superfamily)
MVLLPEFSKDLAGGKAKTSFNGGPASIARNERIFERVVRRRRRKIAYAEMRVASHHHHNTARRSRKGEVSGTTTTSDYPEDSRTRGDSPIIGAGLFVDGDVGGAGSTGKARENIKIPVVTLIVEMMRKGMFTMRA